VWAGDGAFKGEWRDLVVVHSKRLLSALDLEAGHMKRIVEYDEKHRNFLKRLPSETQHQVANRTARSLRFSEELT
jgi:hypothetical protein